jgi:homogentisate 1,2-dioxygenase
MPFYHRLGLLPHKRHTAFRQADGSLYAEEVMGTRGFSGVASILYHVRPPTSILRTRAIRTARIESDSNHALRMRHFRLGDVPTVDSPTLDRTPLLFNADVVLGIVRPRAGDSFFTRNAQADEVLFVSRGEGVLESLMGELAYRSGDYLVIPRGIAYRLQPASDDSLFLTIETAGQIRPPARYRNEHGQLLEHSPYCERDIRVPEALPVHDETGEFALVIKRDDTFTEAVLDHHPFDVVGWDGYYYPWALSIHDFEPITGSLHQPPPVHQTFEAEGLVICSFVPRLFDYHPEAVPAPYNHSNVMSDEILFYANDQFMSRAGIGNGSLTLHPGGLTHGPQPGRAEASIGKQRTEELAVMLDTFRPTMVSRRATELEEPSYERSWLPQDR